MTEAAPTRHGDNAWQYAAAPIAVVFIASACVLVLEIVGARLVARHVGSGLYTWTSVIGVILAGLAAGNGIGGVLADRLALARARPAVGVTLVIGSVLCATTLWSHWVVFHLPVEGWALRTLTGVTLAFFLPAAVLGAASPIAAKWAVVSGAPLGRTLGALYAAGSTGAIAGTLAAGFLLIPLLGSAAVVALVALVLAATGVLLWPRLPGFAWLLVAAALTVIITGHWPWSQAAVERLGLHPAPDALYWDETAHQSVKVSGHAGGMRTVTLDGLDHGYVDPANPERLEYGYIALFAAVAAAQPGDARDALALGGGAYTLPRWLSHRYRDARLTVVELDPGVTRANRVAAGLDADPGFEILHQDARLALRGLGERPPYDLVFADVYQGLALPHHLATREFLEESTRVMASGGVFAANIIDSWERGRLLAAFVNTARQVFNHVAVLAPPGYGSGRSTFVVLASREALDTARIITYADTLGIEVRRLDTGAMARLERIAAGRILTDDHAPVEHLLGHRLLD